MNPKVPEDQVGQFSTGGVDHFYSGANSATEGGLDIRIIFRDFIKAQTLPNLSDLKDIGFDTTKVRVLKNCHAKLLIVDGGEPAGQAVLLGSHNISNAGITVNRDASLLFEDGPLAQYYQEIFLFDWDNRASSSAGDTTDDTGAEILSVGAPTPAGKQRIP